MALRQPFEQSYYPPLPTRFTLFLRSNLLWQFVRFVIINLKMLLMIRKH